MLRKKAEKEPRNATQARIKTEMAEPRIAKSARKEYAKLSMKAKRRLHCVGLIKARNLLRRMDWKAILKARLQNTA